MHLAKIELSKKLRLLEIQSETLKVSKQRLEITEREISRMPAKTKVYESIGRMFALTTVPEMTDTLKSRKQTAESIIQECDTHKQYLVKNLKDQEENLRELVQQKRDAK